MTTNEFGKIVRLSDVGETVADKDADVRGLKVIDKNGEELGTIDALLVDDRERKVRFIEVVSVSGPGYAYPSYPSYSGI